MSFFKKTTVLFICFLTCQLSFAMNKIPKFKFNKIANKVIPKNKSFKDIGKKLSVNRPKVSFSTIKFNSSTWKKYAMLGGLAAYGLWQWNESIASADSESKENNWDELSEQEKSLLADKYNESTWTYFFGSYLTSKNFKKASLSEQHAMIHAITRRLEQGHAVVDLDQIYENSNQKQKDILLPCIITSLKQGKINDKVIVSIYKISNREQQRLLAFSFTPLLAAELNIDLNMISKTQTGGHILDNIGAVYFQLTEVTQLNKNNKKILQVVKNAIKSESNYAEKGNVVFYHAQMWDIFILELFYTKIHEIKHKRSLCNYIFPRFMKDGVCSENATLIQEQRKIRKKLMKEGRFGPYDGDQLLFLNYALFGNAGNYGSSSFNFFHSNFNITEPDIILRDIFIQFGIGHIYEKYKHEFDAVMEKLSALSKHGNMLQIAIPREHLKKHLYLTTTGGSKRKAQIKKDVFNYVHNKDGEIVEVIENRKIATDDVIDLIETLKNNPEDIVYSDQKEFVWIVTADTIQKAIQDGVQIKSFNAADPEKLKQVTDELENLLKEKLADHWKQPEPTPWECYKMHKQKK